MSVVAVLIACMAVAVAIVAVFATQQVFGDLEHLRVRVRWLERRLKVDDSELGREMSLADWERTMSGDEQQ